MVSVFKSFYSGINLIPCFFNSSSLPFPSAIFPSIMTMSPLFIALFKESCASFFLLFGLESFLSISSGAIGTLVERTTRLTLIVPLKEKDAFAVRTAFARAFKRMPDGFRKTLTYDRGSEMSEHKLFTKETEIQVYFADPRSPWQRGTNENTNGLIRQYFPKGTDFRVVALKDLREAERRLNSRPRKALEFYTPSEKFYELITNQKIAIKT